MTPKSIAWWLAGALALLGSVNHEQADSLLPGGIWVLGDSIGVGIAGALTRAHVPITSRAANSTTARQWRQRLPTMSAGWRFVVISLGTNDAQSSELRREFANNIAAIANELRARGHIVCLVLPPSTDSTIPTGQDFERLSAVDGLLVVHEHVDMANKWHPTAAGYDRLAQIVDSIRRNHT